MDFFEKTGKMAIGSRLRMLTDKVTADASQIYRLYGVEIKPKWFPVFFVLSDGQARTITGIAKEIGHTHPSVSNIVKEMRAKGLLQETADRTDKRRNVVALSDKGREAAANLSEQCSDVAAAIESISRETRNDLWSAIAEWEEALAGKSLLQRVQEAKTKRESRDIRIVPYQPKFQPAFKSLNEHWITSHWHLEAQDLEYLDHPQQKIIDRGGHIFVATYRNEPVGVCALCKMNDSVFDYELAKLAVSPEAQGKGIGILLCEAVVNKAKELGAKRLFLESNTLLKPAIHIYRKIGFMELPEYHPAYERGDIQMELIL